MPKLVTLPNFPGVSFYESKTRTWKGKADRCYYIRYQVEGKRIREKVGWVSEGINATIAARLRAERVRTAVIEGEAIPVKQKRKQQITFAEFMREHYFPWSKANKKPASHERELALFKNHLAPEIGEKLLNDISQIDLERVKSNMRKAGLAPRTVNYALDLVRASFNRAIEWNLFKGENPGKRVKRLRFDNRATRFLSLEEAQELLTFLKSRSRQLYEISLLSLRSGMRAGEIFNLRWQDIDLVNGLIHIRDPKNKTSRTALITEDVHELLQAKEKGDPDELVFKSRTGAKIKTVSKAFHRAVKLLGFNEGVTDSRQKVTFHTLRHTFASWLAIEGVPLHIIADLLGHRTLAMTSRYAHLSASARKEAISKLPSFDVGENAKGLQFSKEKERN